MVVQPKSARPLTRCQEEIDAPWHKRGPWHDAEHTWHNAAYTEHTWHNAAAGRRWSRRGSGARAVRPSYRPHDSYRSEKHAWNALLGRLRLQRSVFEDQAPPMHAAHRGP